MTLMSKAEEVFWQHWNDTGNQLVFPFEREHRFQDTRRWRIDFANLENKLALEILGWSYGGGHGGSRKSFAADIERTQSLVYSGWVYFPIDAGMVTSNPKLAIELVSRWVNKFTDKRISLGW